MHFYMIVPKVRWQVIDSFPTRPEAVRKVDLAFATETVAYKFFDPSAPTLSVETKHPRTSVRFLMGPLTSATDVLELSRRFVSYVDAGDLVGFYLILGEANQTS